MIDTPLKSNKSASADINRIYQILKITLQNGLMNRAEVY